MGLISRVSSRTYRSPNMFRQVVRTAKRAASESASGMSFSFASARQDLYSNASGINQVDLPTGTGMMGILPNHVPTLGVLAAGWATVYEADIDLDQCRQALNELKGEAASATTESE